MVLFLLCYPTKHHIILLKPFLRNVKQFSNDIWIDLRVFTRMFQFYLYLCVAVENQIRWICWSVPEIVMHWTEIVGLTMCRMRCIQLKTLFFLSVRVWILYLMITPQLWSEKRLECDWNFKPDHPNAFELLNTLYINVT